MNYLNCGQCSLWDRMGGLIMGKECIQRLAKTSLELLDVLEKMEWSIPAGSDGARTQCPKCFSFKYSGHRPDCTLDNLLKNMSK